MVDIYGTCPPSPTVAAGSYLPVRLPELCSSFSRRLPQQKVCRILRSATRTPIKSCFLDSALLQRMSGSPSLVVQALKPLVKHAPRHTPAPMALHVFHFAPALRTQGPHLPLSAPRLFPRLQRAFHKTLPMSSRVTHPYATGPDVRATIHLPPARIARNTDASACRCCAPRSRRLPILAHHPSPQPLSAT